MFCRCQFPMFFHVYCIHDRCSTDLCYFLMLASTQQHRCHFAAIMLWRCINFHWMQWLSSLSKARLLCNTWNLIGWNLWVLFWGFVGSNGLVRLYSFGAGSISAIAMQFLYVSSHTHSLFCCSSKHIFYALRNHTNLFKFEEIYKTKWNNLTSTRCCRNIYWTESFHTAD